ncbi:MAG: PAS domain S-box protein [Gammaproteobacteria bacterium]
MNTVRALLVLMIGAMMLVPTADAADDITLGIYAYRTKAVMLERYAPLARYLDEGLGPDTRVHLEVLALDELEAAVNANRLDLVFTNPRHYILLRSAHTLSGAIATLNKLSADGTATHSLGGVILTRAGRADINTLRDIRDLRVATASPKHLGGYQCQAFELREAGIALAEENTLIETGEHDATVRAVLDGEADVGLVRTEILEDLTRNGDLDPSQLKIINRQALGDYPFISSTRLYPEWPMVALPRLAPDQSRRISALLLALEPDHPAARAAGIAGFVPPADYLALEAVTRTLRLPPYDHVPPVPWTDIWHQNRITISLGVASLLLIGLLLVLLYRRNRRLAELLTDHRRREETAQLVNDVSNQVLNAGFERADAAISTLLERAGRFMRADRAYLFRLDGTRCDTTHEWCAPGIPSLRDGNQGIDPGTVSWLSESLGRDGSVIVGDSADLPSDARDERALLSARGGCALAGVTIRMDERVSGFLGFDGIHARHWTSRERGLLTVLAQILAGAQRRWDAEHARAEGEKYFRSLFESSADGIAIADADSMIILQANPRLHHMLGYANDSLEGLHVQALHPPDDWPDVAGKFAAQARGELTLAEAVPVLYADGDTGFADISTGPVDLNGRRLMIGHFRDVTERLRAEERMRVLEFALNRTAEAIYLADSDGRLKYVNQGAAHMLGYAREDLRELSIADIDTDFPLEQWPSHFETLRREGGLTFEREYRRKDGSTVAVEVNSNHVHYQGGDYDLGFARDISQRKAADEAIRASEERLALAGKAAFDLIYECDPHAETVRWFGDIDGLLGYPPHRVSATLSAWLEVIHPDDIGKMHSALERHRTETGLIAYTYRVRAHDGSWRVWSDRALPVLDASGAATKWVGVCADITDQHHAQERLRLAASVFTHAREGVFITDADSNIIAANDAFETLTGYPPKAVMGRNARLLQSGHHDKAFFEDMYACLEEDGFWQGEIWNRRRDGSSFASLMTLSTVTDDAGEITHYVGLFSDITAQKSHEEQLRHIAHHDALTDLPNRMLLADRLAQAMAQARRRQRHVAVIYMDLDGFKAINDSQGHEVGDEVLVTIAQRMREALRETDTVGRLGGDEFVAILADLEHLNGTATVLERLLKTANEPILVNGAEHRVSASLGVTFYPQEREVDGDQLLRQADQAMYQAKNSGRNRYQIFDQSAEGAVREHHMLLSEIRRALDAHQFVVHFQPRVNMASGEVDGAEALVRWQHPRRGLLRPDAFLPAINNHSLSVELDWYVMESVLDQIEAWDQLNLRIPISVNIGSALLKHEDLPEQLHARLEAHPKVSPELIELEILESSALAEVETVSATINRCAHLGIKVALDDFGTGDSSLAYLKTLPAAYLKIDSSFVRDMLTHPDELALLDGVIALAGAFSRTVIAEGVESEEQGSMLLQLGCKLAQGFVIANAMPPDEFTAWLAKRSAPRAWRELGPVPRVDLPILFAPVEQEAWMRKLRAFVNGEAPSPPELDAHTSRFGHWLATEDAESVLNPSDLTALRTHHNRLYSLARKLVATAPDTDAERSAHPPDPKAMDAIVKEQVLMLERINAVIRAPHRP